MKRILTAAVFLPAFILILGWGTPGAWGVLVALAAGLGAWEVDVLAAGHGFRIARPLAAALAGGACLAFLRPGAAGEWVLVLLVAGCLLMVLWIVARPRPDGLTWMAGTLLAGLYPGLLLAFLVGLRVEAGEAGRGALFYLFAVIWFSDTLAYYGGRVLGRHPLAATLSPKKTIEGAAAGVAAGVAAAVGARYLIFPEIGIWAAPVGAALAVLGIVGDLGESALKRGAGVKDSGSSLPGHGGILDRVDSMLLAAPAFYYYYQWAIR